VLTVGLAGHLLPPTAPTEEFQKKLSPYRRKQEFAPASRNSLPHPNRDVIVNDRKQRRRDGNAATSTDAKRIRLGDIDDLHAFVSKIARTISDEPSESEELLSEGIALACERATTLTPGESLQQRLAGWLESRLRDYRRKQHPEWRRNSRAGTNYTRGAPTGLAWEHAVTNEGMQATDQSALIESRLRLRFIQSEADLRDPRVIGRRATAPRSTRSARSMPTSTASA
jgi:hypothetical protein